MVVIFDATISTGAQRSTIESSPAHELAALVWSRGVARTGL